MSGGPFSAPRVPPASVTCSFWADVFAPIVGIEDAQDQVRYERLAENNQGIRAQSGPCRLPSETDGRADGQRTRPTAVTGRSHGGAGDPRLVAWTGRRRPSPASSISFGAVPDPQEYAPRTLEILLRLQGRMRGMDPDSTWDYAIDAFNTDIVSRLARAGNLAVAPDLRDGVDPSLLGQHQRPYVSAQHRQKHHGSCTGSGGTAPIPSWLNAGRPAVRGPTRWGVLERHLQRSANEGLATHIEQSNIAGVTSSIPPTRRSS